MRRMTVGVLALLALGGCTRRAAVPDGAAGQAAAPAIAWRHGDVDDAFAEARDQNKPVLLYWGAKWCPPCNAMKATLFRDPAFVAQTRAFVPVYLDGDSQGAQAWGERFGIAGYPTVIVLRPDRSEVTRLANTDAPAKLAGVLRATAARTTSVDALLRVADTDPRRLTPDDWRLLAAYGWFTDQRHFKDQSKAVALLERLAAAAPDPALGRRFAWNALLIQAGGAKAELDRAGEARFAALLEATLAHPDELRPNVLGLGLAAPRYVRALPDPARRRLGGALAAAVDRIGDDPAAPAEERLWATTGTIALGKAGGKAVPPALLAKVRARLAAIDKGAVGPMARQSVVPLVAEALDEAGQPQAAIRYLQANLATAEAPAYHLGLIAELEEELGHKAAAVDWARRAFEAAEGRATRVQWAIDYADMAMKAVPADQAAVGRGVDAVLAAVGDDQDDYAQRTSQKLQAWFGRLEQWGTKEHGGATVARARDRLLQACGRSGKDQGSCAKALAVA